MSSVAFEVAQLVDMILSDPPTDNAELLALAAKIQRDADVLETVARALVAESGRLRSFVVARQARMDAASGPSIH